MNRAAARSLTAIGVAAVLLWSETTLSDAALEHTYALVLDERFAEARKALAPLLARDPEHPRLQLMDGILRMREGKPLEAIGIFKRLQRDHPDMFEAANNLAVLYAELGRLDDARKTLLSALARQPEATLYANLGDVYRNLARRAYADAHRLGTEGDAPRRSPGQEKAAVSRSQPICVRTAFGDRGAADDAARWMRERGLEDVGVRRHTREEITAHQVYLAPFAGRSEAAAKVREIRGRRIRDVAIISNGTLANGVSLGVYRSKKNMRRRLAELQSLGYPALSRTLTDAVDSYVIEARVVGDRDHFNAAWSSRFPGHSVDDAGCADGRDDPVEREQTEATM